MDFCLKKNTLTLCIYNTLTKNIDKKFIFFGDIPDNVKRNLRSGKLDAKLMSDYFGKRWQEKLGLKKNTKTIKAKLIEKDKAKAKAKKANKANFEGAFDFNLDEIKDEDIKIEKNTVEAVDYSEFITYVTDVTLYPEDSIFTLKEKIYLATGIPIYRQFIFVNYDVDLKYFYSIFIGNLKYKVNYFQDTTEINGVNIDKNLFNNRELLRFKTKETFKLIDELLTDDIYLTDFNVYGSKITNKESIIKDNYLIDIIYYGLVKKYFPMFSRQMFIDYLVDESLLMNKYPLINTSKFKLEEKFDKEKAIINTIYNNIGRYFEKYSDKITLSITEIKYNLFKTYMVEDSLFIRNLIDIFEVSEDVPFIEAYITKNDNKFRILKYYKNQEQNIIETFLDEQKYKITDELIIYFYNDDRTNFNHFTINKNAYYEVFLYFNKFKNIDFSSSLEYIIETANNFINLINKNINMVMKPSLSHFKVKSFSQEDVFISDVVLNVKWNNIFDGEKNEAMKSVLNRMVNAGIIERRLLTVSVSNISNFRIIKGINQELNKFYFKKGIEVGDYFSIFHDEKINNVWKIRYGGKILNIENNISDVTFNLLNIVDEEFIRIINYILWIIDETEKEYKNLSSKSKTQTEIKKDSNKKSLIKKLRSIDPLLYNFSNDKDDKYSRICQKKFRPTNIYNEDEFKTIEKQKQTKLHPYINYTTGKTVWYECPKSLPYLGFITGKHPSGFCIPKCKKVETEGNKNIKIKNMCMNAHNFNVENKQSSILKFGKSLDVGQLSYVHPKITSLFDIGEKQLNILIKNTNENYNGIAGSKILCCFAEVLKVSEKQVLDECKLFYSKNLDNDKIKFIEELYGGDSEIINNVNNKLTDILCEVYNINIIQFNTEIIYDNEILNNENSNIVVVMDDSTREYLINGININLILLINIRGVIYPIIQFDEEFKDIDYKLFSARRSRLKPKEFYFENSEGIFNNKSNIYNYLVHIFKNNMLKIINNEAESKFIYINIIKNLKGRKYVKFISEKYIKYILIDDKICIGIHNSINYTDVPEIHKPFNRKKYNLQFKDLYKLLMDLKIKTIPNIICKYSDPDTAIGLQFGEIYCWISETNKTKISTLYPHSVTKYLACEPYKVNMALYNNDKSLKPYDATTTETYYKIYSFKLFKYEIYKRLLLFRDANYRKQIIDGMDNQNLINSIKSVNKFDYYKINNILNNSDNIKKDLNNILLQHDISELIKIILRDPNIKSTINEIIKEIIIPIDSNSKTNNNLDNIIVSFINYDKSGKIINKPHDENLFYKKNKLKIHREDIDVYRDELLVELKNELLITYELNDFNLFFIINYFEFKKSKNSSIVIQYV